MPDRLHMPPIAKTPELDRHSGEDGEAAEEVLLDNDHFIDSPKTSSGSVEPAPQAELIDTARQAVAEATNGDSGLAEELARLKHSPEQRSETIQAVFGDPFDPNYDWLRRDSTVIKYMRHLSAEEAALPITQQRALIRERAQNYRTDLNNQELGVSELITDLYEAIKEQPNGDFASLWGLVAKKAPELRLGQADLERLYAAVEGYTVKRQTIQLLQERYPDSKQLFAAVFGFEPAGDVTADSGSMMLMFHLDDHRDYAAAFLQKSNTKGLTDKDIIEGNATSHGAAFYKVGPLDLEGIVAINRRRDFEIQEVDEVYGWSLEQGRDMGTALDDLVGFDVEDASQRKWALNRTSLRQESVQRFELHGPGDTEPRSSFQVGEGSLYRSDDGNRYQALPYSEAQLGDAPHTLQIFHNRMIVKNTTNEAITITIHRQRQKLVPDSMTRSAEDIHGAEDHEQQHLYNGLSTPQQAVDVEAEVANIVSSQMPNQQAADEIIKLQARTDRRRLMDERAQDEILAYLSDGSSTETIRLRLSKDYDYARENSDEIAAIPQQIVDSHGEYFTQYRREATGTDFEIDHVRQVTTKVFTEDYSRDVERWIGAVDHLAAKGYKPEMIVALLQFIPGSNWTERAQSLPGLTDGQAARYRGGVVKPEPPRSVWRRAVDRAKDYARRLRS